ncbi:hypothetical protein, partial [Pseudomonas viridiflava]|uniref:hypothetical protein n=1 Tax=Pseudomonas viridiflava TaxID=33069 RepID=UPI0013CECA59
DAAAQALLREALKTRLKVHLSDYMIPSHVLFLASLPPTPNGKVDRKALPSIDAFVAAGDFVAPVGELEQQIAAIWQNVLELDQVSREDHFFE